MVQNENQELVIFLDQSISLLQTANRCGPVLFSLEFRENFNESIEEVMSNLNNLKEVKEIQYPSEFDSMKIAGLNGNQLNLKLNSFESSMVELEIHGGIDNLEQALDKGGVILGSLAGAIPGFGSFAQELIDFILKEIKKRAKFWKKG